jgi:hypothetical protein
MIHGELGRYPLYIDSALYVIRYWFKLQHMNKLRLPKQAYVMWVNRMFGGGRGEDERQNWVYFLKHCLDIYGFSHVWIEGGVGDQKMFLKVFKQRMIDCFLQDWNYKINSSERYSTYRSFKSLFQSEQYLLVITIKKFRTTFARFRVGMNQLNINKRYLDQPRTCSFCLNEETEIHFLLYCNAYAMREKYIDKYCNYYNNTSLKFLLQNTNAEVTKSVAMYIFYSMREREVQLAAMQTLSVN